MEAILVKKGQDRREKIRVAYLARRVVGMYRLMDEQMGDEKFNSMNDYVAESLSKNHWRKFRTILFRNLNNDLLNDDKMSKMITKNSKDTGSLKDMMNLRKKGLSEQALLIRVGNLMEKSIREFLCDTYKPYDDELTEGIINNAGYNIQRDISVKKGGTVVIAEVKYNFNLDTEKSKAIVDKMDLLSISCKDALKGTGLKPNVCLVSLRYPTVNDIPKLKSSLEGVRTQYMVGYSQFFNFFGIKVTKAMWDNLHHKISEEVTNYFEDFISRQK